MIVKTPRVRENFSASVSPIEEEETLCEAELLSKASVHTNNKLKQILDKLVIGVRQKPNIPIMC